MSSIELCLTSTAYQDHIWWIWFHVTFFHIRFKDFWFYRVAPLLTNTAYQGNIRWTWFHVTFVEDPFKRFWLSPKESCFINTTYQNHIWRTWFCETWRSPIRPSLINITYHDHIWWTVLHVTFSKGPFLTFLIVTCWTLQNKLYIQGACLTILISCDGFRRFLIWPFLINTLYQQHDGPNFMWLFSEGPF